ncbi:unnamed protein product [Urochloa humidicola]
MQAHSSTSSSANSVHTREVNSSPARDFDSPARQIESTPGSQAHSAHTAGSSTRARRPRTQTKWPEDWMVATRIDDNGWPTPDSVRERFVLLCGLIGRERMSINRKGEDLTDDEKTELFGALEEKLQYPTNLSEADRIKAFKKAMSEIMILQRRFKAHFRTDFVRKDELPFEKHGFLKVEDWEQFVDTTNSPYFEQLSQEMKEKRAKHNKPHRTGRKGYHGKKRVGGGG